MSDQYEEYLEEGHYNPYDPNLETGFSFGVNDSGFNFGIDLFSSQAAGFAGDVHYPELQAGFNIGFGDDGFNFGIDLSSGQETNCWIKSYGRGVGRVITDCPADKEKQLALCYPRCREGFTGVGPVCWQDCPSGYRDDGAFCAKPAAYGRGVGRIGS